MYFTATPLGVAIGHYVHGDTMHVSFYSEGRNMGRKLNSCEIQQAREWGFLGDMVADQNHISMDSLYPGGVEEFESLYGPTDPRTWVEAEKAEDTYELDDSGLDKLTSKDIALPTLDVHPLVPHEIGKEFYFEAIDVYRRIILSCKDKHEIYWMHNACYILDTFMALNVENWTINKPTFERLYPSFKKADGRVERKTILLHAGTSVPRKEYATV
jgi:hypothetical protein